MSAEANGLSLSRTSQFFNANISDQPNIWAYSTEINLRYFEKDLFVYSVGVEEGSILIQSDSC